MKKDFLDELVELLGSTGVTPEQYMIEHSLFFDKDVVDKAFDEMLNNIKMNKPVPVRKSTKQGVVYQNGQQKLWKSIYQNVPDIEVTIDSDGNREVRALINRLTGVTISQGANSSIMFGKISHIWGEAINPLFFTALWNIVIVPAYINDVLDKNDDTHSFVSRIKQIYKAICWTKYDVENKLTKLGLTKQEIDMYAPDVSVLTGITYKLNTIPMKTKTREENGDDDPEPPRNYQTYTVNGNGPFPKGKVAKEAVQLYACNNPEKDGTTIVKEWLALKVSVPNFIETETDFNKRIALSRDPRAAGRSEEIQLPCGDVIYVSNQYTPERIQALMTEVNAQPWGIIIS